MRYFAQPSIATVIFSRLSLCHHKIFTPVDWKEVMLFLKLRKLRRCIDFVQLVGSKKAFESVSNLKAHGS